MATPTRIFSLNLGSQTIGLAEFHVQAHGGLVLQDYRLREIPTESVEGEIRHAQMVIALREMMNELQLKHGRVNYAVSGQSVFARFVKLPAVDE
jgi:type IV pilus assembly protein PilM